MKITGKLNKKRERKFQTERKAPASEAYVERIFPSVDC